MVEQVFCMEKHNPILLEVGYRLFDQRHFTWGAKKASDFQPLNQKSWKHRIRMRVGVPQIFLEKLVLSS